MQGYLQIQVFIGLHITPITIKTTRPWCPTLMEPLTFTVDSVIANFDIDSTNKPDYTFIRTDINGTEWRWGFVHFDGDMDLQSELPREFKQNSNSTDQKVQW